MRFAKWKNSTQNILLILHNNISAAYIAPFSICQLDEPGYTKSRAKPIFIMELHENIAARTRTPKKCENSTKRYKPGPAVAIAILGLWNLSRPFHMFGHVFLKLLCLQEGRACAAFD